MQTQEKRYERIARITIAFNGKLTELVERFYDNQGPSPEKNEALLRKLNQEWKQLIYKANSLNKGLNLLPDTFEKTIVRNHLIILILRKESRLSGEYLNTLNDSLLQELSENDEQLEVFTTEYLRKLQEHKAAQSKSNLKKLDKWLTQ